ncbi:MAG: hypothetical protein HY238_14200, partial [Acidobacteria bacterium]|nr:hypothetical protein [Acidobacteriota bacterium]
MRTLVKKWLGRVLGKSGPPVVAIFLSGEEALSRAMALQMRELVPDHPHIILGAAPLSRDAYAHAEEVIALNPHRPLAGWLELRRRLGKRWIALAPFVWEGGGWLRWMPWLLAPRKLLAFNSRLERHHLRFSAPIASWRFLRGQNVGDIFRPTPLAALRKIVALAGFPLLAACWVWVHSRRRGAAPLAATPATENGITVLASSAALDQSVAEARSNRILLGREDLALELAACFDDPRVWMAYAGEKAEGEAKLGEQGTWSILGHPAAVMFRREVYLALGGGGDLRVLSLLAWQRGHRTVFAGPAEVAAREPVAQERLVLGAVVDFRTAAQFFREWSWRPSRWRAVLAALDVKPLPVPLGPAHRDFVPLLRPGLHTFRGRPPTHQRRVAVVSPYLPFPLSHGGAIRIFNLLRAAAREADIYLFAF